MRNEPIRQSGAPRSNRAFSPRPKRPDNMIYGLRPVLEAIRTGKEFEKIIIQKGLQGEIYRELDARLRTNGLHAQYVPKQRLDFLCNGNHQGVVAYLSLIEYNRIEDLLPCLFEEGKTPLLLIFDRITDVRNFGAMVRTAECAGADAVILPAQNSAPINEDSVKTSAGALLSVPVCREENLKSTIHLLKASGVKVYAASEKASIEYTEADFTVPTAFILGSEENGVSPEYLKLCDEKLRIPLLGKIDSLNVSVANGVFLYEALRQRKKSS